MAERTGDKRDRQPMRERYIQENYEESRKRRSVLIDDLLHDESVYITSMLNVVKFYLNIYMYIY